MLQVKNLSIKYPDKELSALKDVNFELPKGSICFLSGDSGAGQTTLCLAIAGFLKHARPETDISGMIKLNGNPIDQQEFRQEIAITLENPYSQFSGLKRTVLEEMAFGLEMRGFSLCEMKKRIKSALATFGISHLLSRNPKTLSGGETQKVIIACSYVLIPELWILDRPLTELDPLARFSFLQNIKHMANQNGTTIIIVEEPACDLYLIATHLLTMEGGKVELSLNTKGSHFKTPDLPASPSTITFTKISVDPYKEDHISSPSVKIKDIGFQYSPDQPKVFDNLHLSVAPGECLWITGPNGCGKTTLAKIIAGILKSTKGEVSINGINPMIEPVWKVAHYIAYAFQNPDLQIFSTNLWDEVSFGPKALGYSINRCNELTRNALKLFDLTKKEISHPHDLNRSERKRLGLASAFAMDTPVMILDEPTQFQDSQWKKIIKEAMDKTLLKNKSILCITHDSGLFDFFKQ